jgi:hypothetical protein
MLCVVASSHSCSSALPTPYSVTCNSVTADSSAVPNCHHVSLAYCSSRTVSDRIFYKTLRSFFESFHLFSNCPLGLIFISILRHPSILFSIFLSIHITTRLRIRYKTSLFSIAFYVLRPYYICHSTITTM